MNVWVFQGTYDGDLYCSTHLTEKGALIAGIKDLQEYVRTEPGETLLRIFEEYMQEDDLDKIRDDLPEKVSSRDELMKMTRERLDWLYGLWVRLIWDNHRYNITITRTNIEG